MVRVAGVDGCRGGWLVVTAAVRPFRPDPARVVPHLDDLIAVLDAGTLAGVAVDMPIGLPDAAPRASDRSARALLGPRRSSVFPTPARAVLDATDHADAVRRSRDALGVGLPVQAWHLVPRIAELDRLVRDAGPGIHDRLWETHPELAFATLAGAPPAHPKRTRAGRRERLSLLRPWVPPRRTAPSATPRGAAPDDVLDALVLALRAAQWVGGWGPPPVEVGDGTTDRHGLPLRVRG
ncbi:MAG: DUF429 domain-containing protein [Microthrixaceae bacterium]